MLAGVGARGVKLACVDFVTADGEGEGFLSDDALPDGVALRVLGTGLLSPSSTGLFTLEVREALDGMERSPGREDADDTEVARVDGLEETPDVSEAELIADGDTTLCRNGGTQSCVNSLDRPNSVEVTSTGSCAIQE